MKKQASAVLLFTAFCVFAQAPYEFASQSPDGNATLSIRTDRIVANGEYVTAWVYTNMRHPSELTLRNGRKIKYMSAVANWMVGCRAGTIGNGEETYYGADGYVVYTNTSNPWTQTLAIPDSVGDDVLRAICRRAGKTTP